jgi:hypothetical protein
MAVQVGTVGGVEYTHDGTEGFSVSEGTGRLLIYKPHPETGNPAVVAIYNAGCWSSVAKVADTSD